MSNEDSKSRSGRFDLPANELVEAFNATITFEQRVCPFDIEDSKVHATMLARQNIISKEDAEAICRGLDQVAEEIRAGKFVFSIKDEDIHMAIEKRMTEIVGPPAGASTRAAAATTRRRLRRRCTFAMKSAKCRRRSARCRPFS